MEIILVIPIICSILGVCIFLRQQRRKNMCTFDMDVEVVEICKDKYNKNKLIYEYDYKGNIYKVQGLRKSYAEDIKIGDYVTIKVNPDEPDMIYDIKGINIRNLLGICAIIIVLILVWIVSIFFVLSSYA